MNRGCLARDTIVQLDNTLFFVGNDYGVYRLDGLTPRLISKPWVVRGLRNETPTEIVGSKMEYDGHSFYILRGQNGCYVYDAAFGEWYLWRSLEAPSWEWSMIVEASGNLYAASRTHARFVQLSREFESDYKPDASTYGTEIVLEWSAHLPVLGGRRAIPSIRVDGTKGRGAGADVTQDAYIEMALSKDNGITKTAYRRRSIGKQGEYLKRAIWRLNGRAREPQAIAFFRSNDPMIINGVAVGED
jgi:hypothetical protein